TYLQRRNEGSPKPSCSLPTHQSIAVLRENNWGFFVRARDMLRASAAERSETRRASGTGGLRAKLWLLCRCLSSCLFLQSFFFEFFRWVKRVGACGVLLGNAGF